MNSGVNSSASLQNPAARAGGTDSSQGAALVIGAGGGLGAALAAQLTAASGESEPCQHVMALSRSSLPAIDYGDEASLKAAAVWVSKECASRQLDLRLLMVASGYLHGDQGQPERSWAELDAAYLAHVFHINAIGPALVMKHFLPLFPRQGRCVAAFVSAKVGSIGDNALGGWYGYRASKAALNQLVKTASIELTRKNRQSICVALHPGTVDTGLSRPFAKTGLTVRPTDVAATELLAVLAGLPAAATGSFRDYQGNCLPW